VGISDHHLREQEQKSKSEIYVSQNWGGMGDPSMETGRRKTMGSIWLLETEGRDLIKTSCKGGKKKFLFTKRRRQYEGGDGLNSIAKTGYRATDCRRERMN